MLIAGGRANLPDTMPSLDVRRVAIDGSGSAGGDSLRAAGQAFFPKPANVAAYELATTQAWDFTPDVNATIDRGHYAYTIVLADERGNNAQPGNLFYGFEATWALTDLRPK